MTPKTCPICGTVFDSPPAGAKFRSDLGALSGWYWNCCGTTLFVPLAQEGRHGIAKAA